MVGRSQEGGGGCVYEVIPLLLQCLQEDNSQYKKHLAKYKRSLSNLTNGGSVQKFSLMSSIRNYFQNLLIFEP